MVYFIIDKHNDTCIVNIKALITLQLMWPLMLPRLPVSLFVPSSVILLMLSTTPAREIVLFLCSQIWSDPRLSWDPTDYDGTQDLALSAKDIWVPNIALRNRYQSQCRVVTVPDKDFRFQQNIYPNAFQNCSSWAFRSSRSVAHWKCARWIPVNINTTCYVSL